VIEECRVLAKKYQYEADEIGNSPKKAAVLRNISRGFSDLASQFETLALIVVEERKNK